MSTVLPASASPLLRRGWQRHLYLALGWLNLVLAFIGALLPVMPTTVFLICAAACFCRSSPALEARLLKHPRFGPTLRAWRAEGAISRKGKIAASAGMSLGMLLFLRVPAPRVSVVCASLLMLACAAYVLSRPRPLAERQLAADLAADLATEADAYLSRSGQLSSPGMLLAIALHLGVLALLLWPRSERAAKPVEAQAIVLQLVQAAAAPPTVVTEAEALKHIQPKLTQPEPQLLAPPELPPEHKPRIQAPPPPLLQVDSRQSAPPAAAAPPPSAQPAQAATPQLPALPQALQPASPALDSWEGRVLARLERFRRYPDAERAYRIQGVAHVRLRMNRGGQVLSASLAQSSGHPGLDRAALATVRQATPLPQIPAELPDEMELLVPVEFFMR